MATGVGRVGVSPPLVANGDGMPDDKTSKPKPEPKPEPQDEPHGYGYGRGY